MVGVFDFLHELWRLGPAANTSGYRAQVSRCYIPEKWRCDIRGRTIGVRTEDRTLHPKVGQVSRWRLYSALKSSFTTTAFAVESIHLTQAY